MPYIQSKYRRLRRFRRVMEPPHVYRGRLAVCDEFISHFPRLTAHPSPANTCQKAHSSVDLPAEFRPRPAIYSWSRGISSHLLDQSDARWRRGDDPDTGSRIIVFTRSSADTLVFYRNVRMVFIIGGLDPPATSAFVFRVVVSADG